MAEKVADRFKTNLETSQGKEFIWNRVFKNTNKKQEETIIKKIYFGCDHGPDLEQGRKIYELLCEEQPEVIILEGMNFWNNASLNSKIAFLEPMRGFSLQQCLEEGSREKGAVYYYLLQNWEKFKEGEIQVICGEGSLAQEVEELLKKYQPSEILELYILRQAEMYYRNLKGSVDFSAQNLIQFLEKFLYSQNFLQPLWQNILGRNLNLSLFLSVLEQKYPGLNFQFFNQKTKSKLEELMIPDSQSALSIPRIKADLSELRNLFLLRKVEEIKAKNQENQLRIFILYGRHHIETIYKGLATSRKFKFNQKR